MIHASLPGQNLRWRTLIHEALHSFSVGYVSSHYQELRGWEEGVVEHLQRLLRPAVLARLEIDVTEDVFRPVEDAHLFNFYLEALEELRGFFPISAQDFYPRMLHTPLKDRPALVFGLSQGWPVMEKAQLIQTLSKANAVLKRKINQ